MSSYNKDYIERIAQEKGFLRDNLEKVMRLAEILSYFGKSEQLGKSLALKGGTAINLTVFEMPRLSVDIDLDFCLDVSREEMIDIRQSVNKEILYYMSAEGYVLKPGTKNPHTLDSWVFGYTNAAGNLDNIKIEINYSDRCHALPVIEKEVHIDFLGNMKVNVISPIELFASKINALISRAAIRDIYDVNGMICEQLFKSEEEINLLRKIFIFYMAVGSSCKAEDVTLQRKNFKHIETLGFAQVRAQLIPVLRKNEKFDYLTCKERVLDFLNNFLIFSENEKSFIAHFNQREYQPELLFGDSDITERIKNHPMALWKCRPHER
ncbi:MAG: nucleotidyl transferase AbiEii/AbiGii toxin family protein [Paludibacteraceae bacterium]|nr:nucleotidyl transferase AbiEii/AbiGii toxin family protein [Paludibacteraceae bacterium]